MQDELFSSGSHGSHEEHAVSHPNPRWRFLTVLPLLFVLGGCGTTVFLDKFDAAAVGQPPAPPTTGTSTSSGGAVIAANPQNVASTDRWLRLSRTVATQEGGQYIGTFTQNLTKRKASVDLVGFIPKSSPIMMTVFFEPQPPAPPAPLLHIDLLPNGNIRVNDSTVAGTFKFDTLVGFFITFDLTESSPNASILVRGGGNDASLTVPVPASAANFGLGRVRIFAPFEGVNAPSGAFLVNDIIATTPN
jgi:hypothetical protein